MRGLAWLRTPYGHGATREEGRVDHRLSGRDAVALAVAVLRAHRTSEVNAQAVADAVVAAERAGHSGHGLARLPTYAAQAWSGTVDGAATPVVEEVAPAVVRVDACDGFAYPALRRAIAAVDERARASGVAVAAVHRSHHVGAAGHHVAELARRGLVGLLFANTPAGIAPWGGRRAVVGTNPIAFAAPRQQHPPLVVDLSMSRVARGRVMVARREGTRIPADWAVDAEGHPTTDPQRAMDGSMRPMGDAKGAALALMVEVLAAGLTGAQLGVDATSFFATDGAPPRVGQLLIAIAPGPVSGGAFAARLEALCDAVLAQEGARLPGARWGAVHEHGVTGGEVFIPGGLHAELRALAGSPPA
jgi:(2R)-3-sulfolactate dehydrogenase (NADP+)